MQRDENQTKTQNKFKQYPGMLAILGLIIASTILAIIGELAWSKWERMERGRILTGSLSSRITHTDGFIKEPTGGFRSIQDDAYISIAIDGEYVSQLQATIGIYTNTPIELEIQKNNAETSTILTRPWQSRLKNTPYIFMRSAVFEVQDRPEKIVLRVQSPGILIADVIGIRGDRYDFRRAAALGVAFFLILIGILSATQSTPRFETVLLLTLLSGGGLLAVNSPLEHVSWDESIHYRRADLQSLHSLVPQPTHDVFSRAHVLTWSYSMQEQNQINSFFDSRDATQNQAAFKVRTVSPTEGYFRQYREIGYLPSAAGLLIGRSLGLPNHEVFQLGRIANLISYAVIAFIAISLLPFGKLIMASVALLPTSIFLATHYSYDAWVTCLSMLGLALFFRVMSRGETPVSSLEKIALIAIPLAAVGPKAIYCFFILIPLLIPKTILGTNRDNTIFKSATCVAFLYAFASFSLPFIVDGPGTGDSRGGAGVNSAEQVAYILANPTTYAFNLLQFMGQYTNPLNMEGLSVDFSRLGPIDGFYPILALFFISFLGESLRPKSASLLKLSSRVLILLGSLGTIALIATALYIAFTPVGSATFAGVQSRYLTPLLTPMLLVLLPSVSLGARWLLTGQKLVLIVTAFGLIFVLGIWSNVANFYY